MSSIPDDDEDGFLSFLTSSPFDLLEHIKNSLPPAPEDVVAVSGDIVALFVYSYLDHILNELYTATAAKAEVTDLVSQHYDPSNAPSLPVWFDITHLHEYGQNWLANYDASVISPYAPAIALPGLAFVTMSTSWLLWGYFTGAFLNRNTLECKPSKSMIITFQTWLGMTVFMVLLAYGSDVAWGKLDDMNALSAPARGGLTKADADFLFDSLTVLSFWRYMYNWLLGYRR